ncbi:MAG: acyl-CoA thioesterase [Cyclobacteriaceae bacterium]
MQPRSTYAIRFNDCDPFNHLNNSRYFDYLLNAREDHLKDFHKFNLGDYIKRGLGWVVGSHEISYVRPASYNEIVSVQTSLIKATQEHLCVEMIMMDEPSTHLKAVLWTKFIGINMKTGKKENHSTEFMTFAEPLIDTNINFSAGLSERVKLIAGLLRDQKLAGDNVRQPL